MYPGHGAVHGADVHGSGMKAVRGGTDGIFRCSMSAFAQAIFFPPAALDCLEDVDFKDYEPEPLKASFRFDTGEDGVWYGNPHLLTEVMNSIPWRTRIFQTICVMYRGNSG